MKTGKSDKHGLGDLPFAVDLRLELDQLSFGQHSVAFADMEAANFSNLDIIENPVFYGRCYFGRNTLRTLGLDSVEKFGILFHRPGENEEPISDGIPGHIFRQKECRYSYARVYAEAATRAQIDVFLIPDAFSLLDISARAVNFHLVTSINEHERIDKERMPNKDIPGCAIIAGGEPGIFPVAENFALDIGDRAYGHWWFRVRLASLDLSLMPNKRQ